MLLRVRLTLSEQLTFQSNETFPPKEHKYQLRCCFERRFLFLCARNLGVEFESKAAFLHSNPPRRMLLRQRVYFEICHHRGHFCHQTSNLIGRLFYSHLPVGGVEGTITQVCALFKKHNISSAICTTFNNTFLLFFVVFFFFNRNAKTIIIIIIRRAFFHLNGIEQTPHKLK